MNTSPLTALREALDGAPSLRQLAKKMRISAAHLSAFETGRVQLAPHRLKEYAELVGKTEVEVLRRFYRVKAAFHREQMRAAVQLERAASTKPRKKSA